MLLRIYKIRDVDMLFNPMHLVSKNKESFLLGGCGYLILRCALWFFEFTHYDMPEPFDTLSRVFNVPISISRVISFPLPSPLNILIGFIWGGLFGILAKRVLFYVVTLFSTKYTITFAKRPSIQRFLKTGIVIAACGSCLSTLFNPVFFIIMRVIILFHADDTYSLAMNMQRQYYITLAIYSVSTFISGALYGIIMFYISSYPIIMSSCENRSCRT